jgi:hypothetical protein
MIFEGSEPIAEGEPEVDVRAQGRLFDLHNCATFLGTGMNRPTNYPSSSGTPAMTITFPLGSQESWSYAFMGQRPSTRLSDP